MKKKSLVVLALAALSSLTACGRNYTGEYRGVISMTPAMGTFGGFGGVGGVGGQPFMGKEDVVFSLNQNGNAVSGAWSDAGINYTLQGVIINGDSIQANITLGSNGASGMTTFITPGMTCTYMGNITASGAWPMTALNASLNSAGGFVNTCPTLTLNVVKVR